MNEPIAIKKWLSCHVRQVEPYQPRADVVADLIRTHTGLAATGFSSKVYETGINRLANHLLWTVGARVEPCALYQAMRAAGYVFIHDDRQVSAAVCVNVAAAKGDGRLFLPFEAEW